MKKQTIEEFFELVSENSSNKPSVSTVKKVLYGLYDTILQQLEVNNECNIPGFGKFMVHQRKTGSRYMNDLNNPDRKVLVYIEPKLNITFKANDAFDVSVNEGEFKRMRITTKQVLKRRVEDRKLKSKKRRSPGNATNLIEKGRLKLYKSEKANVDKDILVGNCYNVAVKQSEIEEITNEECLSEN